MRWTAALLAALTSLSLHPGAASACSECGPPGWAAPPDGAEVPEDAVVLAVYTPMWANDPQALTLVDDRGSPVRFHVVDPGSDPYRHSLVLDEPLVSGRGYALGYQRTPDCFPPAQPAQSRFTAAPAMALPISAGTLEQTGAAVGFVDVATSAGSCSTALGASIADLRFTPSVEAAARLPVATVALVVDGATWAETRPGAVARSGVPDDAVGFGDRRVDRIFAHCPAADADGGEPPADTGLAPGLHHVELRVGILGVDRDATTEAIEVRLDCPAPANPAMAQATSGCAIGGKAGPKPAPFFALLLLAAARLLPRRGRQAAQGQ